MPKLKTNKAVKKRFKVTKDGKVLCAKSLRRHLMAARTAKKKRQSRGMQTIKEMDARRMKAMLPYG